MRVHVSRARWANPPHTLHQRARTARRENIHRQRVPRHVPVVTRDTIPRQQHLVLARVARRGNIRRQWPRPVRPVQQVDIKLTLKKTRAMFANLENTKGQQDQ